jgi:hypothetical protein
MNVPSPIIMLPLIYDISLQVLQLIERRDVSTPMIIMQAVNLQLRKFLDKRTGLNSESSLYAAVLDLLSNLLPAQQPPQMQGQFMPQMQGQMAMDQMPPTQPMMSGNQLNMGNEMN